MAGVERVLGSLNLFCYCAAVGIFLSGELMLGRGSSFLVMPARLGLLSDGDDSPIRRQFI